MCWFHKFEADICHEMKYENQAKKIAEIVPDIHIVHVHGL